MADISIVKRWLALVVLLAMPLLTALTQTRPAGSSAHEEFLGKLVGAAIERTHHTVRYVSSYVQIPYPGGDVPEDTGVCTDEIIRSYRAVGIDLQREVHEDLAKNIAIYRREWKWRQKGPDRNIDHRRVPNLMVFFGRKGQVLPITGRAEDYLPGDIVAWNLVGSILHIGIVVDQKSPQSGRYMVVHNIGEGPKTEDVLFNWIIIGHYRYFGPSQ